MPNRKEKNKYSKVAEPKSFFRETLKEMENIDSTGILKCVDQHVVDTYNAISAAAKLGSCLMQCAATFDYIGISFLIIASIIITEYYGLYCSPFERNFYMTFTALVGLVPIICAIFPWFDSKRFRLFRVILFITLGCSGVFPLAHLVYIHGFNHMWDFINPIISSLFAYLTGVWIYANRFPEKKWPGKLDRFGIHSHSVWHVFVCIGIYEHYKACLWFFEKRLSASNCSI
ncbi:15340_t:CDS:2 [Entrophospora sp. SA101]|nr:15340_t:CDS:2 [Entrophospora sp. SA101]CAJ0829535.1 3534_t:CDS:2 [Entrophospora sp. SA101]CAJ0908359.1 5858_t:CDS:2 [Entrophospora sp. SA101]